MLLSQVPSKLDFPTKFNKHFIYDYVFRVEFIALGIRVISEVIFFTHFLILLLLDLLVLSWLQVLVILSLELRLLLLLQFIQLLQAFDCTNSALDCVLVLVDLVFHVNHLQVSLESELSHWVMVEVKLILINLLKVSLYIIEVLQG
jgi:hypothetical protein